MAVRVQGDGGVALRSDETGRWSGPDWLATLASVAWRTPARAPDYTPTALAGLRQVLTAYLPDAIVDEVPAPRRGPALPAGTVL